MRSLVRKGLKSKIFGGQDKGEGGNKSKVVWGGGGGFIEENVTFKMFIDSQVLRSYWRCTRALI